MSCPVSSIGPCRGRFALAGPVGPGGVHHGPNGVVQGVFGPLLQDVPDFTVTPEEIIASGDRVAVVARYGGTGAASGERLDLPVVHVWDVRDGKIARFRQFADTVKFLEVVPTTVAAAGE